MLIDLIVVVLVNGGSALKKLLKVIIGVWDVERSVVDADDVHFVVELEVRQQLGREQKVLGLES